MRPLTWLIPLAMFALPRLAPADDWLVVGGAGTRGDCMMEMTLAWQDHPLYRSRDTDATRVEGNQTCHDGEECDHDLNNQSCTFNLRMCFCVRDPALRCWPKREVWCKADPDDTPGPDDGPPPPLPPGGVRFTHWGYFLNKPSRTAQGFERNARTELVRVLTNGSLLPCDRRPGISDGCVVESPSGQMRILTPRDVPLPGQPPEVKDKTKTVIEFGPPSDSPPFPSPLDRTAPRDLDAGITGPRFDDLDPPGPTTSGCTDEAHIVVPTGEKLEIKGDFWEGANKQTLANIDPNGGTIDPGGGDRLILHCEP